MTEIEKVLPILIKWNDAYRAGNELVDDKTYDALYERLRAEVESGDPSDQWVVRGRAFMELDWKKASAGTIRLKQAKLKYEKFRHTIPMGSQNKSRSPEEFSEWFDEHGVRLRTIGGKRSSLVVSSKLDGISLALYYEGGKLIRGVTRGEKSPTGEMIGFDITPNVMLMQGCVTDIPNNFNGFVRAEVILTKSDRDKYFPDVIALRNQAAGIASREDSDRKENKYLTIVAYQISDDDGELFSTKADEFNGLANFGFVTPDWVELTAKNDILDLQKKYEEEYRQQLDYDIDGIIVEENNLSFAEALGVSGRGPVASTAFKFKAEKAVARLLDIEWSVGPTGVVTPIGIIEPVILAGAEVSRPNFANVDKMKEMLAGTGRDSFAVGDMVLVSRRGDVIPKGEKLVVAEANPERYLTVPDYCPCCDTKLSFDGAFLVCTGDDCQAQVAGGMIRWIRKLNVKDWGPSLVATLYEAGLASEPSDLYTLDLSVARKLESDKGVRLGKKIDIAHANLMKDTELPLYVFMGSLGIKMCARSMFQKAAEAGYDTLEKLRKVNAWQLEKIPKFGAIKAEHMVAGIKAKSGEIDRLLAAGVTIKPPVQGTLKGKSFCFTGVRDHELHAAIEAAGGTMKSSYSRSLSYLVAKDPSSNSGKAKKARKDGVKIIGREEAWSLVS